MVRDTPPSQDVSTHQIWNSYLKEYRRYGPDTKAGRTDSRTTDSAITICLPKFLWGHKKVIPTSLCFSACLKVLKLFLAIFYILCHAYQRSNAQTLVKKKLEDLKVLRCSPDLLNNVVIGQTTAYNGTNFVLPYMGGGGGGGKRLKQSNE